MATDWINQHESAVVADTPSAPRKALTIEDFPEGASSLDDQTKAFANEQLAAATENSELGAEGAEGFNLFGTIFGFTKGIFGIQAAFELSNDGEAPTQENDGNANGGEGADYLEADAGITEDLNNEANADNDESAGDTEFLGQEDAVEDLPINKHVNNLCRRAVLAEACLKAVINCATDKLKKQGFFTQMASHIQSLRLMLAQAAPAIIAPVGKELSINVHVSNHGPGFRAGAVSEGR